MKDQKKTPRQIAGEKLSAVYAELAPSQRDQLQNILLEHAFLSPQTYIQWADWNEYARATAYLRLMNIAQDAADAWIYWATTIEAEGLSTRVVREAILRLIEKFVTFRYLQCPSPRPPVR